MSPITILHTTTKFKVKTIPLDVKLTSEEVTKFTHTPEGRNSNDKNAKHNNINNNKEEKMVNQNHQIISLSITVSHLNSAL